MPHFGFWSWPQPFIGPLDKALAKIARIEGETPWVRKIDKAVWRGTVGFNPIGNLKLRPELLRVAMGQDWADVKTLKMEGPGQPPTNVIPIEYFCRYKYIVYTEVSSVRSAVRRDTRCFCGFSNLDMGKPRINEDSGVYACSLFVSTRGVL